MTKKWLACLALGALATMASACGSSSKSTSSAPASVGTSTTAQPASTTQAAPTTGAVPTTDQTSGSVASSDHFAIAGLFENLQDPFWTSVTCGAQAEATARGVALKLYTSTAIDTNLAASNFQSALLEKPNGVMASPFNSNQFVPEFQDLMKSGVPVVTSAGTDPRTEYKSVFSDTDTARFAKDVLSLIPAGAGTMAFLGGAPGIPPLEARTKPFLEAIKAARPDLKVLETEYSGFDPNKAATDLTSLMLANPDLKLIVAADGPDGIGAASAVEQAKVVGKITLIAFDAVPPEVESLKKGTIQALIAQNPIAIGRQQVDALVDYLKAHPNGGAVPTTESPVGIPQGLLTSDNVADPKMADFIYKPSC